MSNNNPLHVSSADSNENEESVDDDKTCDSESDTEGVVDYDVSDTVDTCTFLVFF